MNALQAEFTKFSLKVRDKFKIRIKKNYINNFKKCKGSRQDAIFLPPNCQRFISMVSTGWFDAGRSLRRFYLSGNNFIGTRICILDTFFFF